MDRLRALAWFCKVVELQGMSEAARALGVSKAVVSKYVAWLEDDLGARLLHRTTRVVRPTATGRAIHARARALLDQMHELEGAAKAEKGEPVGTLRISAPVAFGLLHLGSPIAAFARANPAVHVDLSLNDRFVRIAEEGFDVAIRIAARLEDDDVVAVRLAKSRMVACAAPSYLERAGRPHSPEDLASHACIAFTPPASSGRVPWRFGAAPDNVETVWVEPSMRVDNSLLQRDLARSGLGVAFLLSFVAEKDLRAGTLVALFEGTHAEERNVYAVYPSPRHASAKVRSFVHSLQAAYHRVSWATASMRFD